MLNAIRRHLFVGGLTAWTLSTTWFFVLFHAAPSQWPVASVILAAALGAFGSAAALLELRRALVPSGASWSDQEHLRWVLFWASIVFVIQFTGIAIAVKGH